MMRSIQRLRGDQRGVAAVEFALIFPVLMTLYFGTVELVNAFSAQRRIAHIAASIADLTAQGRTITTAQLNDLFTAGTVMMSPWPASALKQRVASLKADGSGQVSVAWTANSNYSGGATLTVPTGYLAPNESVIVVEVIYNYVSPLRLVIPGTVQFKKRAYFRPRVASTVEKV